MLVLSSNYQHKIAYLTEDLPPIVDTLLREKYLHPTMHFLINLQGDSDNRQIRQHSKAPQTHHSKKRNSYSTSTSQNSWKSLNSQAIRHTNMVYGLRHQIIDQRTRGLLKKSEGRMTYLCDKVRISPSHNRRHASFVEKIIRSTVREGSPLNPQQISRLIPLKNNLDWIEVQQHRNASSRRSSHYHRRLTPREFRFVEKSRSVVLRMEYLHSEENSKPTITDEINYSAMLPTSEFAFQDKHGWRPSKAVLHDCRKFMLKIDEDKKYHMERRKKKEKKREKAKEKEREKEKEKEKEREKEKEKEKALASPRLQLNMEVQPEPSSDIGDKETAKATP